jgi:uncharacterized membrane protein
LKYLLKYCYQISTKIILSEQLKTIRKNASVIAISLFYILAGINHFISPLFYKKIMPTYIPWHITLIYISGLIEIFLGLLLLPLFTRKPAAWGIILLLIAVFPANIFMMTDYLNQHHPKLWITIVRLPLQILLIWWAYKISHNKQRIFL